MGLAGHLRNQLAVVADFDLCEVRCIAFYKVGQFVQQPASLGGLHFRPAGVKGISGRGNSFIDICRVTLRNTGPNLTGVGIDAVERFS